MEEDRCERLGPPVFVRGHLRKYAVLVGADPDCSGVEAEGEPSVGGTGGSMASLKDCGADGSCQG